MLMKIDFFIFLSVRGVNYWFSLGKVSTQNVRRNAEKKTEKTDFEKNHFSSFYDRNTVGTWGKSRISDFRKSRKFWFFEISKVTAWCTQASGSGGMVIGVLEVFFEEISKHWKSTPEIIENHHFRVDFRWFYLW